MKVLCDSNGNVTLEAEGKTHKEVFENLASMQEVFQGHQCGKCKNKKLRFVVRHVDKYTYHELRCTNPKCGAKLGMGQHQDSPTMFPKRKDKGGNYLPDFGWLIYNKETEKEE